MSSYEFHDTMNIKLGEVISAGHEIASYSHSHDHYHSKKANELINSLPQYSEKKYPLLSHELIPFKRCQQGIITGKIYKFKRHQVLSRTQTVNLAKKAAKYYGVNVVRISNVGCSLSNTTIHFATKDKTENAKDGIVNALNYFHALAQHQLNTPNPRAFGGLSVEKTS